MSTNPDFQPQQPLQDHPQATLVLVMGILVPVVGWILGHNALKEIDNGAPYSPEGALKIGYMIGKILTIISIAFFVLWLIIMILGGLAIMAA